jgi:microcystin-dependent protein
MALQDLWSGTFDTSNQYVKYAIELIENSTDVGTNTSSVTVRVWAWRTNTYGPTYGTGTVYLSVAGNNYSAAITSSQKIGTTKILLIEQTLTVYHNDDGTRVCPASAYISMDVVSSSSNGWNFTLTSIPRASGFSAFSMSSTLILPNTQYTVNYTLSKKYSGYSADLSLVWGGTTVATWNDAGDGARTHTLTTAEVNNLVNAMGGDWGGIGLTMQTKNGSTNIGGAQSLYYNIKLDDSIKPSVSGLVASIFGTGRDSTLGKYVQGMSKVTSSFTVSPGYGASISTTRITVRRQSDQGDSQSISGNSGTISNPVALSGVYEIIADAWDSRGRYNGMAITITVNAYSPPSISKFTASRGTPTTSVLANIVAAWSMGTDNPTTVIAKGKNNVGTETTLYTLSNSTAGSINTSPTWTGQVDTSSYTYTVTVTDSFGNVATAAVTIGVSFVEFCISKGKGISVGKIWERGALDVAGDIYQNNNDAFPAGVISAFAGSAAPGGYLLCQGQAVSRTTYAKLFAAIGTSYGTGDGSTTFNLPNLQGRVPVGLWSSNPSGNFKTLGSYGGEEAHTLNITEMPSHGHNVSMNGTAGLGLNGGSGYGYSNYQLNWNINGYREIGADANGGGGAHNNLQPFLTLNYIIKI